MSRLAVLLRAVNVGGAGKLAMADFKACLAELGYAAPATLGAAGSAVVETDCDSDEVEVQVAAALNARFGLATEVFVRRHDELHGAFGGNPFGPMAVERPGGLIAFFLRENPAAADIEALRAKIVGPEEIAAGARLLYIAYGAGMGTSKLSPALIERTLKLRGTGRNFNTLGKLAALTA